MSVSSGARKRRIIMPGETRSGGGLVLPGGVQPGMRTLAVPREYVDEEQVLVGKCLVPGCGQTFYRGQEDAWQKHVGWCARRNRDAIEETIAEIRARRGVLDPGAWDPEIHEHMQKVGRRMRREGRLEVKPNERAGFS
jgi:hypothetical protein